jgi:phosphoribosyl-ATP pyrophosphohydrolase
LKEEREEEAKEERKGNEQRSSNERLEEQSLLLYHLIVNLGQEHLLGKYRWSLLLLIAKI